MAAVAPSSDQAADLLKDLSLDAETKTSEIQEPAKKVMNGDAGAFMYHQGYNYMPYGAYSSPSSPVPTVGVDGNPYATQHYQYPGPFYQSQTSASVFYTPKQANPSQREVPTSTAAEKVSLTGTAAGNPNNTVNSGNVNRNYGAKSFRPNNQHSSANVNGSYKRRGMPTGFPNYQDPRIGYDGFQSPFPWFDASMFPNGSSRHATSSTMNSQHTRPTSGLGHASGYMNLMYPDNRMYGQYGNGAGASFGSFGYNSWTNGRGWVVVDNKYKPRARGYGNENTDGLSELNRGPRAKGFKNQELGPTTHEGKNLPLTENNKEENLSQIPEKDEYNREDFPEDYSDAKFFVIKSYSEDDVHKSVKYSVWASTPNGNKKLDAAYSEAKGKNSGCPVFLLFSVNTSGQFVGLAEMVGPVDFNKTVEYWQQDKWSGCFPVKWHIIKDVPNNTLRHITLENNENKPVTNSRDTQEVIFEKGIQILKIFKGHKGKTSILDDFGFYAARERIMQEKKAKQRTQKQVVDGTPDESTDGKIKPATIEKEGSINSTDATLTKDTLGSATIEPGAMKGDAKLIEENGSGETVEKLPKGAESAPSSGKNVVSNVVASAC